MAEKTFNKQKWATRDYRSGVWVFPFMSLIVPALFGALGGFAGGWLSYENGTYSNGAATLGAIIGLLAGDALNSSLAYKSGYEQGQSHARDRVDGRDGTT